MTTHAREPTAPIPIVPRATSPKGDKSPSVSPRRTPLSPGRLQISTMQKTKSYDEESNIHEEIPVTILIPNKTTNTVRVHECRLKIGETALNIKLLVEGAYGIPCDDFTLTCDGIGTLIDPVSLNDYTQIVEAKKAVIHVVTRT
ncbi:hypothetical protein Pelo_7261 [Pelomyxa schiedti]|nr:hypothetical protein Pelo_7261 [Pelomyxa schiedti]